MPHISQAPSKRKYTWGEIKQHNSFSDCWIVVHGKVYDVSRWAPKHPGGNLIVSGAGRDSTAFMHSYHPCYVMEMLTQYHIGEVDKYDNYYTWDSKFYNTIKLRVEKYMKENNMTRDSLFMYFKTVFILAMWIIFYYFGMIKGYLISTILFGFFHAQLGINAMHDGNHGAYSSSPFLCSAAGFLMNLMGSSSVVWLHQHNIGHHPNSNNSDDTKESSKLEPLAYDPDANGGFPLVRLNPSQPYRWYMRYQHIYIWLLICFMTIKWFINDIKAIRRRVYSQIEFYEITAWDLYSLYFTKVLFLIYCVLVPVSSLGIWTGLLHIFIFATVVSYELVLMFAVNHLTVDANFPNDQTPVDARDWAALQVTTSSNFATDSSFWTVISGGLNFQIEHHLFPGVNHVHLRAISPIVKDACKEFGVPYHSAPTFSSALYSYYSHVKNMGRQKVA